jgi:antitoxin component HigA of HigAB toxin-antitoxin module
VPNSIESNSSPRNDRVRNREWTERQTMSPEARREYEQERLIVGAFESIAEAMESAGLSYADLARELGCSRSYITQVFSGQRNATLRTMADLAWACRSRVVVSTEPLMDGAFVDCPVHAVSVVRSVVTRYRGACSRASRAETLPEQAEPLVA